MSNSGGEKMAPALKSAEQIAGEVADLLKVDNREHIWLKFIILAKERHFTSDQRDALKKKLARTQDHYVGKDDWIAYVVLRDIKDFSPDQREVLRGVACSTQESRLAYDIFHRIKDLTDEQRTRLAPLVKRREILKREYDLLVNKRRPMG